MSNHKKTRAVQLRAGDVPVNEHTQIETMVVVAVDGTNLQDILDDFEARITTLEP